MTDLLPLPALPSKRPANPGAKKFFIQTYGCQMNEYDSARIADLLVIQEGMEETKNVEDADLILVNTCSVREKAQEKVFSQLGRWKHLKQTDRPVVFGVAGCVA